MAPLHRQNSHYMFQYSVPLATSGRPTRIIYSSPSAPYRMRGVRPTITVVYKNTSKPGDRRRTDVRVNRQSTPERDPPPASSRCRNVTPVPDTPSPSPTPPPSPVLIPSDPVRSVHGSSRAGTPDVHTAGSVSSALRNGRTLDHAQHSAAPLTRSASRSSMRHEPLSLSRTSRPNKRPAQPSPGVSLWTRFGIKNGSPTFVRRDRTSSSTDRDCVTAYYESFSVDEIRCPPDLSDDRQLQEGDVYINTVYDSGVTQLWIWTADGGKVAFWKVAKEGDVREDGRRLSITPKLGLPSWVKPDWCVRQMLKHHKGK